jgi:hypothetical protein
LLGVIGRVYTSVPQANCKPTTLKVSMNMRIDSVEPFTRGWPTHEAGWTAIAIVENSVER